MKLEIDETIYTDVIKYRKEGRDPISISQKMNIPIEDVRYCIKYAIKVEDI